MSIAIVVHFWRSLFHDLSLRGLCNMNLPWYPHFFEILTKGKYWPSLQAVVDGQSVVGAGYWPHNISDKKSFLWLYLDWLQKLMIWYGLQPSWLFIYEDVYWVFVVIAVKDSVNCCLYGLRQISLVFILSLFIHLIFHLLVISFLFSLFVIILIASFARTHNFLGSLRDIFLLLRVLCSICWGTDIV